VLTSNGTTWASSAPAGGAVTGQTIQYGSSTTPSGYLKCDGSTYNISAYPTLAGVLGSLPTSQAQYYTNFANAGSSYTSYVNSTAATVYLYNLVYTTNSGASYTTTALSQVATNAIPKGRIVWTGTNYVALNYFGNCCGNQVPTCYTTSLTSTIWTKSSLLEYINASWIVWTGARVVYGWTSATQMLPRYSTNSGVSFVAGTAVTDFYIVNSLGVTYGASTIVGVGSNIAGTSPRIYTSPDGGTWTSRTVPAGMTGTSIPYVSFANSLFIAIDNQYNVASSPDGVTWTYKGNAGVAGDVVYLSATSTYYMNGRYSSDLITWSILPVATGAQTFVAVNIATDATRLFSSNNGNTQITVWNPLPYTTGTQFIVPNFGTNALGTGTWGAYNYIKT
jgi:hypothetical protein